MPPEVGPRAEKGKCIHPPQLYEHEKGIEMSKATTAADSSDIPQDLGSDETAEAICALLAGAEIEKARRDEAKRQAGQLLIEATGHFMTRAEMLDWAEAEFGKSRKYLESCVRMAEGTTVPKERT